jgi:hypothetical protein
MLGDAQIFEFIAHGWEVLIRAGSTDKRVKAISP